MNMQPSNLFANPKTKEEQYFNKLVMAGLKPMSNLMEVANLANDLTEDDIDLVVGALGDNLKTWLRWLNHLKSHRLDGGRNE